MKIAVIGLGYVGLPLAMLADAKGHEIIGFDIVGSYIERLRAHRTHVDGISTEQLAASAITFTDQPEHLSEADIVIICVPTPLIEKTQLPDLEPVKGAVRLVAPQLKQGALLILESTVNPGVCDEVVIPLLAEHTNKQLGRDIELAYCPERINPGDPTWNVSNINRVVGGHTEQALQRAIDFYTSIIDAQIKPMGSLKEAEAVKVVENSFRDINIAFVNELAMSFHSLGINIENVIDGAATKPFAFMAHRPGCGVGGHCIPVDPYYLIDYASGFGFDHELLRMARATNEKMPRFTVGLLKEALKEKGKTLSGSTVALLGLSYKADIGDVRESPALQIKELLLDFDAHVVTYDPYVTDDLQAEDLDKALQGADAVMLATAHGAFRQLPAALQQHGVDVLVDGRNMFRSEVEALERAGVAYRGIGIH